MATNEEAHQPPPILTPTATQSPTSSRTLKARDSVPSTSLYPSQGLSISSPSPLSPVPPSSIPPIEFNSLDSIAQPRSNDSVTPRISKPPSPNDTISKLSFSPGDKSQSSGFFFSEAGSSCDSSGFLTPPLFQGDPDSPPFKAPAADTSSLNMKSQKSKRLCCIPDCKKDYTFHKGRHQSNDTHSKYHLRPQRTPYNCSGTYYIVPTAPSRLKDPSQRHVGNYHPKHFSCGDTDVSRRIMLRSKADQLAPVVSRRWSSVEIGTHRTSLRSILPKHSSVGNASRTPSSGRLSRPYGSSSFTPGAIDHDILRTVRERLTLRKVPQRKSLLATPAIITLRRASRISGFSKSGESEEVQDPDVASSASQARDARSKSHKSMFLITHQDIDSITELIEENLQRSLRSCSRGRAHLSSEAPPITRQGQTAPTSMAYGVAPPKLQIKRKWSPKSWCFSGANSTPETSLAPSFTLRGMVPQPSPPTQSTVEVSHVQLPTLVDFVDSNGFVQTVTPRHLLYRSKSRGISDRSAHEVIWEADESPTCMTEEEDETNRSSQEESRVSPPRKDRGDAFDPGNPRNSISEWSMKLPPPQIQTFNNPSDSGSSLSNELTPIAKHPKGLSDPAILSLGIARTDTFIRKASQINSMSSFTSATPEIPEDVVSFPALPSRPTSDWISPLPAIKVASPRDSTSLELGGNISSRLPSSSLYDAGIDASSCPRTDAADSESKWLALVNYPTPPAFTFRSDYQIRRKSIVKMHPKVKARVGSISACGSSIGSSSGERRKSSDRGHNDQHAEVVDNINRPSKSRPGTWSKARPPTPNVVESPITPPEDESSGNDSPSFTSTRHIVRLGHSGQVDQMARIQDSSPPTIIPEFVGIHERMTGARQGGVRRNCTGRECNRPQCGRDSRRPSSNPRVDWIG